MRKTRKIMLIPNKKQGLKLFQLAERGRIPPDEFYWSDRLAGIWYSDFCQTIAEILNRKPKGIVLRT